MSLYKFFDSYTKKRKELTMINMNNPMDYKQLNDYFNKKINYKFPIQIFFDHFFDDVLVKCSKTKREYDDLKKKTVVISQLSQHLFVMSSIDQNEEIFQSRKDLMKLVSLYLNK